MKKKLFCAALCASLVASMMTGCGQSSGTSSSSTEEQSQGDTQDGESAKDGGAANTTEEGKLVYWSMWEATEPQGQAISQAVEAFTADTGIEVDLQFKGRTGIREGLSPALEAGTAIDLFDEDIDRVNTTWSAYLMDLEELVKASDYESTASQGLIAACREVGGGTLKSIPYQPNVFAFFYNTEIFEAAGVMKAPATWAELLDACEKIKAAGYTPITCDDAYITSMFGFHMSRLVGEPAVEAIVKEGKWDDPAVKKTAEDYAELAAKGYFSETIEGNVWPAGQNSELALGTAAMYLNGSWLPNEVKDIATFKWGCFSYPALEGGVDGVDAANYGAQVFAINKDSKNADSAFQLIEYITKGEYDKVLSELSVGIPADTRNTQWPEMLESVKPVMESMKVRYPWAAGAEANADLTPIIKENFLKLCGGTMSAQEFVDAMASAGK